MEGFNDDEKIEIVLSRKELFIIRDSLKGALVRENGMNFTYLSKIAKLGEYIEEILEQN